MFTLLCNFELYTLKVVVELEVITKLFTQQVGLPAVCSGDSCTSLKNIEKLPQTEDTQNTECGSVAVAKCSGN